MVALKGSEFHDGISNSTTGCVPTTPSLAAAIAASKSADKSKLKHIRETQEAGPAGASVENYCLLIERLITEIEAEGYGIAQDMRGRIRDGVIHTHQHETRLLRAIHGDTELKKRMRGPSWRLAEVAEEGTEVRELDKRVKCPSRAIHAPLEGSRCREANTSHTSQNDRSHMDIGDFAPPLTSDLLIRIPQAKPSNSCPVILFRYLTSNYGEDPWTTHNLRCENPTRKQPVAAQEIGWLPSLVSGASKLAQLPFVRSGTSILVTEKSHLMETMASSQDLAALTDSTDTDTYVSALSEVGELALDSNPPCLVEGGKEGPLLIVGDHEFNETASKEYGRHTSDNVCSSWES